MKPSDIVFFRKYCNHAVICSKSDVKANRTVKLLGQTYGTENLACAFMVKGYHKFVNTLPQERLHSVSFRIARQSTTNLTIDIFFSDAQACAGQIELRSEVYENAHKQTHWGAIEVTLADDAKLTTEKKKCVDSFALAIGLYLLAVCDGEWDAPIQKCLLEQDVPVDLADLLTALEQIQAEVKVQQTELEQMLKSYNILITRLQYQKRQNEKRITALRSNLKTYQQQEADNERQSQEEEPEFEEDFDYIAVLKEELVGKRICLVGGKDAWQVKVRETFANVVILEAKNFAPVKMQGSDILIINTNDVGHALTGKAQQIAESKGMRIIFTSKYNMQRFAEEIIYNLA